MQTLLTRYNLSASHLALQILQLFYTPKCSCLWTSCVLWPIFKSHSAVTLVPFPFTPDSVQPCVKTECPDIHRKLKLIVMVYVESMSTGMDKPGKVMGVDERAWKRYGQYVLRPILSFLLTSLSSHIQA